MPRGWSLAGSSKTWGDSGKCRMCIIQGGSTQPCDSDGTTVDGQSGHPAIITHTLPLILPTPLQILTTLQKTCGRHQDWDALICKEGLSLQHHSNYDSWCLIMTSTGLREITPQSANHWVTTDALRAAVLLTSYLLLLRKRSQSWFRIFSHKHVKKQVMRLLSPRSEAQVHVCLPVCGAPWWVSLQHYTMWQMGRAWYHMLSLRYVCIQSLGIILIPQATSASNFVSFATFMAELAHGEKSHT